MKGNYLKRFYLKANVSMHGFAYKVYIKKNQHGDWWEKGFDWVSMWNWVDTFYHFKKTNKTLKNFVPLDDGGLTEVNFLNLSHSATFILKTNFSHSILPFAILHFFLSNLQK